MDIELYELTLKKFLGENLTNEEDDKVRNYKVKYELVRFLVMEKCEMKNFHFTPGSDFMTMPIIDVVNSVINFVEKSRDLIPTEFNDSNKFGNPPFIGTKSNLVENKN